MYAGAHQRPEGHREGGWILVEVLWSALILVIIVGAVLTALNTSTAASGLSRSRSVAMTLAEQDQERLRSYRAIDLSNFYETRLVALGGRSYSVTSLTEWVRDSNGEPVSCTNGTVNADYLLVSSSVTSPTLAGRTVRLRTLFAPPVGSFGPTQGTLAVKLEDYLAAPVQNVDVAITGPDSALLPTNGLGCAIFGYIPAGSYNVSLDKAGWVDAAGTTQVTKSGTVTGGNVNAITLQYDRAAQIAVTFDTAAGAGGATSSSATSITVANSGVPPSGERRFSSSIRQSTINATGLFPFSSGYAVYAGNCPGANPQADDPAYFQSHPGFVQTSPGGTYAATVRVPAINLAVTRLGLPVQSAHVVLTAIGAGCSERTVGTTAAGGALAEPAMPFGTYSVCADDGTRRATAPNVDNTSSDGTATIALELLTGATSGVCS
jgi:Tfp pilus assembly protein PilV